MRYLTLFVIYLFALPVHAQQVGYSPKLIVDKRLTKEFIKAKDTANVFDPFKDCTCGFDTVGNKISITAGYRGDFNGNTLAIKIANDLSVAVTHNSWSDVIRLNPDGSYPSTSFDVKNFLVESDIDTFSKPMKAFKLKYHLAETQHPLPKPWAELDAATKTNPIVKATS